MTMAVDLSDPATFEAGVPHDYFRMLRETDPVHWQPECKLPGLEQGPGYWALTRYEDVAFVSKPPASVRWSAKTAKKKAHSSIRKQPMERTTWKRFMKWIHEWPGQCTDGSGGWQPMIATIAEAALRMRNEPKSTCALPERSATGIC